MLAGEPLATLDRGNLHLATDATTRVPITPAVDALTTIGAVNAATDLLLIHDADAAGQREKKITVQALRAALNIADTDTDERVAAVQGGASGYLWGTDGIDGVLRMGTSMQWTLDPGNAFVTLNVATVDGGTF
jgi:hypothetical protein